MLATDFAAYGLPRSFRKPRAASSFDTPRNDSCPPLGRRRAGYKRTHQLSWTWQTTSAVRAFSQRKNDKRVIEPYITPVNDLFITGKIDLGSQDKTVLRS